MTVRKYLCNLCDRELPNGGRAVWGCRWEWASEGKLKGILLSRGDGAGTSLSKPAYGSTRKKWAHCVKPGGTAGCIPVPAIMLGAGFCFI